MQPFKIIAASAWISAALCGTTLAQPNPPTAAAPAGPTPPVVAPLPPAGEPQAAQSPTRQAVEQRIGALQAKIAITPAQAADWAAFAQVMRDNAASTDSLFQQRAQTTSTMSALENMKSYASIARAYADNTERLATAFESLYGKLSAEQKTTADTLFRAPPPSPPAAKRSRRHR